MIQVKLILMAGLWAGGFIAGKMVTSQAGPFTIAFFRFLIALLILVFLVNRYEKDFRFDVRVFVLCVGLAFLGLFCYNFFFLEGLRFISAGRGAFIVSTVPIVVALVSAVVFKERLTWAKTGGILISVIGACIVISNGHLVTMIRQPLGRGELYFILSVFCLTGFTLLSKHLLKTQRILVLKAYTVTAGTILFAIPAVWEWCRSPLQVYGPDFMGNVLYLAVGPSIIAAFFYYEALHTVGTARATQYMNLIPIFSVCFAVLFLGEAISHALVVGGGFVTAGLYLTNWDFGSR